MTHTVSWVFLGMAVLLTGFSWLPTSSWISPAHAVAVERNGLMSAVVCAVIAGVLRMP